MYKVIFKENESWFEEPIQASEVNPADGWEVAEFETLQEAETFIAGLTSDSDQE